MQSRTTIPFGWDDSSNLKAMKNVTVNSYNAVSKVSTLFVEITFNVRLIRPILSIFVLVWKCKFDVFFETTHGSVDNN